VASARFGPAAADRTRVLEQCLEAGNEDRVAVVYGILRIADQMRKWCSSACLNCAGSRSDSHIFGLTPTRNAVGTHLPRVSAMTK
jgi:hypothetical protein